MTEQEQIEEQACHPRLVCARTQGKTNHEAWAELIKLFAAQTPLERMVLEAKGEM